MKINIPFKKIVKAITPDPIEDRFNAVSQSIKQKSLAPLKADFKKQGARLKEEFVPQRTDSPQQMVNKSLNTVLSFSGEGGKEVGNKPGFLKRLFKRSESSTPQSEPQIPKSQPVANPHPEPLKPPHPEVLQNDNTFSYTYSEPHHASGGKAQNIQDSVAKLTQALKDAKPLRKVQEELYSVERGKRIGKMQEVREQVGGEAGFHEELKTLKGQLPKVDFESLRGKIVQEDIDNLFNAVAQSKNIGEYEKISARTGLSKMFAENGAQVPTNSELKLLNQVFPPEVTQQLLEKRSAFQKVQGGVAEALNIPRSVMASFDLSAPFRQGLFLLGKPKEFFTAFGSMFKQFGSENAFRAVQDEIASRPTYSLMRDSKLALTDTGPVLSGREEQFMSNWAEKIPGVGKVVHASGRAYTGFLNKLRADVFDSLIKKADQSGIPITEELTTSLAKFINSASGRGSLGALERSADVLNGIFFSPRLMASRVNLLNPMFYTKLDPFVRREALKTMLTTGSMLLTTIGLAKAGGANVVVDPRNSDFLKIKIGDTRLDTLGGLQQYLRLAAQLASGKVISSTTGKTLTLGEGYKPLTRKDILIRFFQGKENPVASFITDWLDGQDAVGNKFKLSTEVRDRFIPMIIQDLNETIHDQGLVKGTALSVPSVFGVGVQTYKQAPSKETKPAKSSNRFNY